MSVNARRAGPRLGVKHSGLLPFALALALGGCASVKTSAPLIERAPVAKKAPSKAKVAKEGDWRPQTYTVQKGDTLYGIALEHGFDYKEVAEWNGIEPPYTIRVGQQLKLAPAGQQGVVVTPLKTLPAAETHQADQDPLLKTQPKAVKQPYADQTDKPVLAKAETLTLPAKPAPTEENVAEGAQGDDDERIDWIWPAAGKVVAGFNEASSAKGVDIGGNNGQPVLAAAPGKVVYSGSGLRGYGKLVIIKHNKTYLSAYAHNRQILVKEGQSVTKGQKIAEMGDSDADQVKLHFEIRRLGKPVDPMKYLPRV